MKNEKEKELREEVKKFITDKRSILKNYRSFLPVYKKSKKALKHMLNENISDLNDVSSYREMQEIYIKRIMNTITHEQKKLTIQPETRVFKLSDCFMYSIRFIEKDLNDLLSERYFKELKRVKITDDIIYRNMKEIIEVKKNIINEHLSFLLSFYKMIPSLIIKEREHRK